MLELKTTPPSLRPGLIERESVLQRAEDSEEPVVAVVAPAGYGKTTLLSQFAERTDKPVAWLNLDQGDGDPAVLVSGLAQTLHRAGLSLADRLRVESGSVLTRGVDQLLENVDGAANGVLVLDQVDELPTQSSLDVLGALMTKARGRLQIVMATRSQRGLPFGLLRARGDLVELTDEDLALGNSEIEDVFAAAGVPGKVPVEAIAEATEGWPVAIYLIALAAKSGSPIRYHDGALGNDLYLADYFREELMGDVPPGHEAFLLRSSILPRMSGDLCDFALETDHSAHTLQVLQESNLLVIALDRTRTWFRYHSLLRDFLQAELDTRFPGVVPELHQRASLWFEEHDLIDLAIDHACQASDYDRAAGLLTQSIRSFYASGRNETLNGWLRQLEDKAVLWNHPELAAAAALTRSLDGDPGGAERISRFAYAKEDGRARDDSELSPVIYMVRSFQAPAGVEQALLDARIARDTLQHHAEWAPASVGALALATQARDGIDAAEPIWSDALWRAESIEARPLMAQSRAVLGLAALRRNEWDTAERIIKTAIAEIEDGALEGYFTSALAYVLAARIAVHDGDLDEGRRCMADASRIRPLLTVALPVLSVMVLHEEAKTYVEFADIGGARSVVRAAADILAMRPRLGTLVGEHNELQGRLSALPSGTVGPSSLTGAELRLLPFLVTHLTYPEIGDRLFVSRHTVKTQAMSIYRKLGVSSRSEAVDRARDIGLITS